MAVASAQNLEDAANLAWEFIYSIDNLPKEVQHILDEIRCMDTRVQELQAQIDTESAQYVRHSSANPPPAVTQIPARISSAYSEISRLSNDKIKLAGSLVDVITRTRGRLDVDLTKVRILQGEAVDIVPSYYSTRRASSDTPSASTSATGLGGRDPATQISESLRSALMTPESVSAGPPTKKRRLIATPSIKLPATSRSISPAAPAPPPPERHQRSRLSRQIHPPVPEDIEMGDDDADGDPDEEMDGEEDDGDDERLYCFCQKKSYGDMIACDNEGECPYEWFHLSCVGLKPPIPDVWYCSECASKGAGAAPANKKGRKK